MSFKQNIKLIQPGDPVNAEVANDPLIELLGNTQYLRSWLLAMSGGSALFARDQAIESALLVGQAVYYNRNTGRFERGYFSADAGVSDTTTIAEPAQVWGILYSKTTDSVGTILLYGYAELDISAAVDELVGGGVPAGVWYLSSVGSGTLTRSRPLLAVPVLRSFGSNQVFVSPSFQDFDGKHRHYSLNLTMLPAGDVSPPALNNPHEITNPDPSSPGWLPADHPVFEGNAPVGAKFGYNIGADLALAAVFPPIPVSSAAFIMQRPSVYDVLGDRPVYGQQLFEDTVVLNEDGIWWMTDCYDQVPWPTTLDTLSSASGSGSGSGSIADCDPQLKLYTLKLYFNRLLFATGNAYVQSLESVDPRVVITCSGTDDPAINGKLDIKLDLNWLVNPTPVAGYNVLKSYNPATEEFRQGPVLEAIRAASSNVVLTGGETVTIAGQTYRVGPVSISVLDESLLELPSQLVRLDGVTEENFPVLYLGMPNANISSYIVKFEVPTSVPPNMNFRFRPRILGRSAGTLPPLTASYYIASRPPAGLATPVTVTQSFTSLTLNTVATITANQAVEALSSEVTVQPGDIVYVRLLRDPNAVGDAYNGEVGIMQQSGVLSVA